jgi:tetratricopeptide (TPR) repeat protein
MPYLSWQTVVIGDPLCAPFRSAALTSNDIDKGQDSVTEMPQFFSAWRLKMLTSPASNPDGVDISVIKLLMRADSKGIKQDLVGMRQILEEATSREKRLGPANITLAVLYEQAGEYDKAIERYRAVLGLAPTNLLVLNNLAYALAVRKNQPQEALPLAEKAYSLAPKSADIADTLAWIVHLGGNDRRATGLLAEAMQIAPQNATIHLHAAVVHAALNENDAAQQELNKALQLDPKLAVGDDVQKLRAKLKLP